MSARNQARLYCFLIALGLAGLGALIGVFSHTESYKTASGSIRSYISGNDDNHHVSYLALVDDARIFVIREPMLSPAFSATALGDGTVTLHYLASSEQDVDVQATDGAQLKGKGYEVYELAVLSTQTDYQTSAYASSPSQNISDYWVYGRLLIGLGVATLLFGLLFPLSTLNLVLYSLGGLIGGPIFFFLFIGVFEGEGANAASWKQALSDNVTTAIICGTIGLVIGFIVGIIRTLQKEYLIDPD